MQEDRDSYQIWVKRYKEFVANRFVCHDPEVQIKTISFSKEPTVYQDNRNQDYLVTYAGTEPLKRFKDGMIKLTLIPGSVVIEKQEGLITLHVCFMGEEILSTK